MALLRRAALALLALPLLTGCTNDAKDPAKAGDASDAETAVRAFYDEFARGDFDKACAHWTTSYADLSVKRWNEDDFGKPVEDCPDLLKALTHVYAMVGDPLDQLEVTRTSSELTTDTTARVDVTIASSEGDAETYELTLTDGDWLISGDDPGQDMLEGSSGSSPSASPTP
ncbi:hypothetical protein [Nocardioides sp. MH1]|uniref:hypothetical protein n=1 Tax=Nocardioides sp. MH1 TaxID=3242490 RepID=UPI003520D2DE